MPAVARKKPAPRSPKAQPSIQAPSPAPSKAKVQAPARGRAPKRTAAAAPYAPAKLDAARGVGLAPKVALGVATAAVLGVLGVALFTGDGLKTLERGVAVTTDGAAAALGFGVGAVHVQGASPYTKAAVLQAAGVAPGDSILAVDLDALRARVEAVSWVEETKVVRLLPDTLVIAVAERRPLAVWQHRGRVALVDDVGRVINDAEPSDFPQLPLVVGAGAGQAAAEILPLLHARPKLMERVEALVRVDRRRWDVRLRDGALIQLPALDEEDALVRLDQLEQKARVLELGFAKIDLRDPELVAVRPRGDALRPAGPTPVLAAMTTPAPIAAPVSAPVAAPVSTSAGSPAAGL